MSTIVTETLSISLRGASLKASGTPTTEELIEIEEKHAQHALPSLPLVISRGQGAKLWDLDGKEYIDFLSAFSVVNQGHCHPRIIKALVEQSQKLTLSSRAYHNEHYPILCQKLCQLLKFDMAFAMNSGSEAVDLAMKIARKWGYSVKGIPPNEAMILTITGNYHGKSLGPLSGSSNQKIKNGFGPFMPGIGSMINGRKTRFGSLQDLEYAFKQKGDKIAGLIVECVQGDAGCLPASNDYLRAARALCKKYKVLFIADEIQTGFGRTGYLMSYDAAGIHPDMTILGKALTGGAYTMSMVLGCREAMGQLGLSEHSSTFSGNPLASAVAIEAIDVVLEERLSERSMRLGALLKQRIALMKSPHASIKVTGRGLYLALTIEEPHSSGRATAERLCALMKRGGVLAYAASSRLRIAPPLVISERDLWAGVDVLEQSLKELV